MIRSHFVYDRSVQRDVADTLAAMRASTPATREHIDRCATELAATFHDNDPSFDMEDFFRRARTFYD